MPDWASWSSQVWPRANAALKGSGLIFVFAMIDPATRANADNPPYRLTFNVKRKVEIQLSGAVAYRRIDSQAFTAFAR